MNIVEKLKQAFSGVEWEIIEDEIECITFQFNDYYELTRVYVYLDGNRIEKCVIETASLDNEIVSPYSCHECTYEDCYYWDKEKGECSITDDKIDELIAKWNGTLLEKDDLEVHRIIVGIDCYVNIPHEHLYYGYKIIIHNPSVEEVVTAVHNLDDIINLALNNKVQID